ncbi:hypothetical protein F5X68DRAFT_236977 [Plectosphaerella plurivora]|uniref:Kelch repeat protein n=1 Tax=Plectosphaerella plurivora TaxID=936078 RepID=A0A9P8UZX5_9PEZI|nr:hypothetical protein F5X68DRAFT_236977 [Plectosphaerella plurivora]
MGDRIYYDGGWLSQQGFMDLGPTFPSNATLSIDLTTSWFPDNASISAVEHPNQPTMEVQTIVTDQKSKCFYVWGGYSAYGIPIPDPREFWRFCASGGWQQVELDLPSRIEFRRIPNLFFSASASTHDTGFIFGGEASVSALLPGDKKNFEGFLSFNFTSQTWTSHDRPQDKPQYSSDGTLWGAKAIFVPNYGENGLIFFLGGSRGRGTGNVLYLDFNTVHFMDPVTKAWYKQSTTALNDNFPGPRHQHCIAGVAGENNTYEIYVFGGANDASDFLPDSVHVLSLPSFTWSLVTKVDPEFVRENPNCAVVGNSQFLIWGGRTDGDSATRYGVQDPFKQGLGILDLNTLRWKDEYNPDGAPYSPNHNVVLARTSPPELSDEVRELFGSAVEPSSSDESPGAQPEDQNDSESSSTPVAAIAGGVVGGVALIAITAGVYWFMSRRRRKVQAPVVQTSPNETVSKPPYEQVSPLDSAKPVEMSELHELPRPVELGNGREGPKDVHEMDGSHARRP